VAGPGMNGGRPVVALPVSGLDAEMACPGCKDSAMAWYRGCRRRLERYFAARRAEEFPLEVAMAGRRGLRLFAKEQAGIVTGGLTE